uniref:Putative zein-binding domain-containing protein n=1 Tax=Helianthus annuus TaxID=4232 RepID=A0A251V6C8_HELAN
MLIISLYLDGFFTFVSNKFADTFELEPPCVLCTRVDHALCGKNPNLYYNDSICDSHKKDISSLAYCQVHAKLSDIRTMCESCLLSFAIEKDSEKDLDEHKPVVKKVKEGNKIDDPNICSCCGESLKPKQPTKEFSKSLSSLRASSLFSTSSPRASSLFPPSPRAASSPRASSSLLLASSPRAFSSSLFPTSSPRAFSSLAPMCSPRAFHHNLGLQTSSLCMIMKQTCPRTNTRMQNVNSEEDASKTSSIVKGNKFFGIPLTEAIASSPRWALKPPKKAAPLEKVDLASESIEEQPTDEYSTIQQLKKQVSDNRKTLVTLYMELDEERSAATVAANNAMAMITRLQAEKAGVHMEALQYQRMMDEQAEYDEEAIQILKDLLLKKEEDVRILEAELDTYRGRYGEIRKRGSDEYDDDDFETRSCGGDKLSESWKDDNVNAGVTERNRILKWKDLNCLEC